MKDFQFMEFIQTEQRILKKVEEKGIKFKECYQIGPTIGTHVGPETFGFIAVEKVKN